MSKEKILSNEKESNESLTEYMHKKPEKPISQNKAAKLKRNETRSARLGKYIRIKPNVTHEVAVEMREMIFKGTQKLDIDVN
ncbi:18234_t:CDS:2 [Gigaspora margarita]|uniref:18234_t:CDS:1 n=1 Tax=Gigaspora margarita TaxID=4874 RepID=A0ABN7WG72_GIGMA|nr:18234_t:CDS:2 [Gigaspora margarita]